MNTSTQHEALTIADRHDMVVADILQREAAARASEPANDNRPRTEPPVIPDMPAAPFTPEAAGGLLGEIAEWITDTAPVQVPELSMISAIALIGGLFGGKCIGPTSSGINIFVTTVMETAGGKGHPPKMIRTLADAAGQSHAVTNGDPTSYAALERIIRKSLSTVVVMDEFGLTLQDVNTRHKSAPAASIRKFLLAIYDQANSVFDGRTYASSETKGDDSPIRGPALTVLGMTTTQTLFDGLSDVAIADGFLNRFVFVAATKSDVVKIPPLHPRRGAPGALIKRIQDSITSLPKADGGNIGSLVNKLQVRMEGDEDGEAYKAWGRIFEWQQRLSGTDSNLSGRAAENTIRLATIRALSRDSATPLVTLADVAWGWAIVKQSIEYITAGASKHMAASPAEALRNAIVASLDGARFNTLAYSELMKRRGVSGALKWELDGALQWLLDAGLVAEVSGKKVPGAGSKFTLLAVATTRQ